MTPKRRLAVGWLRGKDTGSSMSTVINRPNNATLVDQIDAVPPLAPWEPAHEVVQSARGATYFFDLPGILGRNMYIACRNGRLLVWGHRNPITTKHLEQSSNRPIGAFAADIAIEETLDPARIDKDYRD